MIRVENRWCGPLEVDLGSPLGKVRIPKAGLELDVEFNDLQLPRATLARLQKNTIEIIDLDAEDASEDASGGGGDAEKGSGAKAPAQAPAKAPSVGPANPPAQGAEANGASAADHRGASAPKAPAKAPEKKEESK